MLLRRTRAQVVTLLPHRTTEIRRIPPTAEQVDTLAGVFSRLTARRPLTLISPDQPDAASAARRARRPV